jgi:sugar phosphate isomerase/epimerase
MIKLPRAIMVALLGCALATPALADRPQRHASKLWADKNLTAWAVVVSDAKKRGPEERAQMLERLRIRHFAYDWQPQHIPTFDAEIAALKTHHINLRAWWFAFEPGDPIARSTLETFKRHRVRPQIWVAQAAPNVGDVMQEVARRLPPGVTLSADPSKYAALSDDQKAAIRATYVRVVEERMQRAFPKTPDEQAARVKREAERIRAFVELARPYGIKVVLYNNGDWLGIPTNQVSVIQYLKAAGIHDVGIVYNFSHARDSLHDDTVDFAATWRLIRPHVVAVNVAGTHMENGSALLPTQGDHEMEMMRVIEESGWKGPVGLLAESGGDAETALADARKGLAWLAAEIAKPGSAGPRPFTQISQPPK